MEPRQIAQWSEHPCGVSREGNISSGDKGGETVRQTTLKYCSAIIHDIKGTRYLSRVRSSLSLLNAAETHQRLIVQGPKPLETI